MINITKPLQKISDPYWDYNEVIQYIESKYNICTRGYTPKNGFTEAELEDKNDDSNIPPYLDFWHWVMDRHEVTGYFTLRYHKDDKYVPPWVNEILQLLMLEFSPEDNQMYMHI